MTQLRKRTGVVRDPSLFVGAHPARAWLVAASLGVAAALSACASTPDAKDKPDLSGEARDTAFKHEPCPYDSSSAERTDVNGDGKPDLSVVKSGGKVQCKAVDFNFDGNIDTFVYYDDAGKVRRRESDFDRDGRPDEVAYYEGGVIVRKELETNFDDKIDTWDFYKGERLVRRERDSDGDAIIDQWWDFNKADDPKCAVVTADRNADGKPDPGSEYDFCGPAYTAPAPTAPPGSVPSTSPVTSPPVTSAATPTSTPASVPGASSAPTAPTSAPAGSAGPTPTPPGPKP